jgi:hypothetical protein
MLYIKLGGNIVKYFFQTKFRFIHSIISTFQFVPRNFNLSKKIKQYFYDSYVEYWKLQIFNAPKCTNYRKNGIQHKDLIDTKYHSVLEIFSFDDQNVKSQKKTE